ncbi:universal stress protein [Bailinhaonella thermotolerans]|uniref:Universal stress protein n=1 Tax=Bailinhaonella thermotolerans TaxID=1070861 RepID=A0A3A4A9S5_9ACTN|nr:universal stress protein [Bailinhaonella thermotolerans]RJL24789.1 universal stress protein [Bailinhaonella thermotolerans]
MRPVMVGADGSEEAARAVEWAADEAARRRAPLLVANVTGRMPFEPREAAERARERHPGLEVSAESLSGRTGEALARRAGDACLLVVGNRGLGGFTGLLLGSTGLYLAANAPCPTVIVRGRSGGDMIVAGVSGKPGQDHVLEFAFEEAMLRHVRLRALHAWSQPASRAPGDMLPLVYDVQAVGEEEHRLLAETVAGHRERFPDVDVQEVTEHGHRGHLLVEASRAACLVVVGSRGRMRLGSATHAVLHHAECPVAVVPHP